MSKINLTNLVNLQNETTAVNAVNSNNTKLISAFDNTLSRDGTIPNQMLSTLDMNSNHIINLPGPSSPAEPVTLAYLNSIVPGVISGVSTISTYATRALAAAATIPNTTVVVQTGGYATSADGGGSFYVQSVSLQLGGFQSVDGRFWQPDFSRGINLRVLGAGQGNGVNDVAAMTAALAATAATPYPGTAVGYNIYLTAGTTFDFSTGQFLINKNGTRIIGSGNRTTLILFNPTTPATLFNFYRAGDAVGVSQCEVKDFEVYSTNSIQKTIFLLQNTAQFLMDHINCQNISSGSSNSIALLYQGRNLLTVQDCIFNADFPVYFYHNPESAIAGNEDADYITFERNQLDCANANGNCYTVTSGLNITNWVDRDSDWALGRYGLNCIDTDPTVKAGAYNWRFEGVRREQEQGVSPTMFVILRGNSILRNLSIVNAYAGADGGFINLSGVERVDIQDTTCPAASALLCQADSTVSNLKWRNLFAGSGATIAISSGLNLVYGREKMGGTNAAPIYVDATYSNALDGLVEWFGPPSSGGHRSGVWRTTVDLPVYNGSNAFTLYPISAYTVLFATIKVTSTIGASGTATFGSGQTPPNGCILQAGGSSFAVDASSGKLSVFHFSDNTIGLVNKLAGSVPVTVEVTFTI